MNFLGIDIAKSKFDICLEIQDNKLFSSFSNNFFGFHKLLNFLNKHQISELSCCLESTGKYGHNLAYFLFKQGFKVSIVNPKCIKAFAESQLIRNKTDKIDSKLIAQYCRVFAKELLAWKPRSETEEKINELSRRIEDLEKMKRMEENRLSSGLSNKSAIKSVEKTIRFFEIGIEKIEKELNKIVDSDDDFKKQKKLLISIPGIAEKSANMLIAEIGEIKRFEEASELVAYSGANPSRRQSGSSLNTKGKISRKGKTRIRTRLYFPAIVSMRHNPIIKKFCERLRLRGIVGKKLVCAGIRKLIHIIFGVLKNEKPFDPNYENIAFSS